MQHTTTIKIQNDIIETLKQSTLPLSSEQITESLRDDKHLVYGYRQITRHVNDLLDKGELTLVGKKGRTRLFSLPGQDLEPWQATSSVVDPDHPNIKVMGYHYTPEKLAKEFAQTKWSILSDTTNRELSSQLTLLVLGSSAYGTLKAHSIFPVAHIRKPLEETNAKLKMLSQMIDAVLNNELIKTGQSGNSISDQTRDNLLEELEAWIMALSTNIRSNIHE